MDKCLMNFEYVYLKAKSVFGEKYVVEKIDRLYGGAQKGALSHHIGCLAGAVKLTKEDYYDMEEVDGMIKYNLEQILKSGGENNNH